MCPARKTPELCCFYISDCVNHHLFYQKLLISLKYAIFNRIWYILKYLYSISEQVFFHEAMSKFIMEFDIILNI